MKSVVTGAAGFIGSHLCEALLAAGHEVIAVDGFIPYYPRVAKERNLTGLLDRTGFEFHALDLRTDPLDALVADAEVVFHLAAMPGLVKSWTDFDLYWTCNVQATERLIAAVQRRSGDLCRFVYASTSSVYGRDSSGDEGLPPRPISPYGVTKLAGENLCRAFAEERGLPLVVLRYFSVYGPRQRPDMGYHRFIRSMLCGEPVTVYGDGMQVRGNTYVSDCVTATIAAALATSGETYNVGGGESASVWDILAHLERIAGRKAQVRQEPARPGDQRQTYADTTKLRRHLGWEPTTTLAEGLARQWAWQARELATHSCAGVAPGPVPRWAGCL
jgi:nucleoside-diphosphate-sugar epimerase